MTVRPLQGVVVPPAPKAELSLKNWFSREYQKKYEAWFNTHVGFRSPMVRLANQVNFSVFRQTKYWDEGTRVLLGKDNWLFEGLSVRAYQWAGWRTNKELNEAIEKLAKLQQLMMEKTGNSRSAGTCSEQTSNLPGTYGSNTSKEAYECEGIALYGLPTGDTSTQREECISQRRTCDT